LNEKLGVTYPVVDVNDDLVQREIDDMRRRFGRLEDATTSEPNDMLLGDMIELDTDGAIKAGGIMNRATISLEYLAEASVRASLVGRSAGDEVTVDPRQVARDNDDLARMLGVDQSAVQAVGDRFLFRIAEVKRMVQVEVDQTLFDRVYGKDAVTDEVAFRARVKEGLENMFRRDSDRLFQREVMKALQQRTTVALPDPFLKRWIQETSEKPITAQEVEEGYPGYSEGLKRQLLEEKVVEKYGLEAKGEEMDAFARRYVTDQFMQYGLPAPEGEQLQQMAGRMLGDREQIGRIRNSIVEQKLMTHFKALLSPKEQRLSYDEFVNLARTA
jgi:trigger factor